MSFLNLQNSSVLFIVSGRDILNMFLGVAEQVCFGFTELFISKFYLSNVIL